MISQSASPIRVETVTDPDRFAALADEWNQLAARAPTNAVFLSWDWMHTWWQTFGRPALNIGVARRADGVLVGIAPFYATTEVRKRVLRAKTLRLLGDAEVAADYLDVIVDPTEGPRVMRAFADWLADDVDYDQLLLCHTDEAHCLAERLLDGRRPLRLEHDRFSCPVIELPVRHDLWLSGLSANRRSFLKRRERQLTEQTSAKPVVLTGTEAATRGLDALFELHRKRWAEAGMAAEDNMHRPEVEAFHRAVAPLLAARGLLRVILLEGNDGPLGVLYGFVDKQRFYFFQMGHDPAWNKLSPGAVVMAASVKAAIEEGCVEFDMLRGDEEYKTHWQTDTRWIRTVRMASSGRGATLLRIEQYYRSLASSLRSRSSEEASDASA